MTQMKELDQNNKTVIITVFHVQKLVGKIGHGNTEDIKRT